MPSNMVVPRRWPRAVILLLAIGAAAALLRGRETGHDAGPVARLAAAASPGEPLDMARVDTLLDQLAREDSMLPRDRWDAAFVARRLGRDPKLIASWVGRQTLWIPYRGTLRGPTGVLMDREGNALDRALLTAAVLQAAGHTVRLAHGRLSRERAAALLPTLVAGRDRRLRGSSEAPMSPVGPPGEAHLSSLESSTADVVTRLGKRVHDQTLRLMAMVDRPDPSDEWSRRLGEATDALMDHWWVQYRQGDGWGDVDPLTGSADSVDHSVDETFAPEELPAALRHTVTVRVVAERWNDGRTSERTVLERELIPSEVLGRHVSLQLWPIGLIARGGTTDLGRFRATVLEQREWGAALMIGDDVAAQGAVSETGDDPTPRGGPMGGLGRGMVSALKPRTAGAERPAPALSALRLEYVIRAPGRPDETVRRAVFDLLGLSARETRPVPAPTLDEARRLSRSLALMMRTEILLLPCQLAPEFVTHLMNRSLVANRELFGLALGRSASPSQASIDSVLDRAAPPLGPLYALAVARSSWAGSETFVDRPTVLTRHRFPTAMEAGVLLADATDIVANDVGVALTEVDGFAVRLASGVFDTNAEVMLGLTRTGSGNTAEAFAGSSEWVTETAERPVPGRTANLPPRSRALIDEDLARGYIVVAPTGSQAASGDAEFTWWRIDPVTGNTLGMGGLGWGQMVDRAMLLDVFIFMSRTFVFEYALCHFIPQAANALNVIGEEFWNRGLHPSWTRRPEKGKDFEDVAVENNRTCLIQAILTGYVATAPLLLLTLRYSTEARLARGGLGKFWGEAKGGLGRFWRDQRGGVRLPPRLAGVQGEGAGARAAAEEAGAAAGARRGGTQPMPERPRTPPDADPARAKTEPDLGRSKTEPDLGRSKTEPDRHNTQSDPMSHARPPSEAPRRPPLNEGEAAQNLRKAAEAHDAASREATAATQEFVQYRQNKPNPGRGMQGDPSKWDPTVDEALKENMWRKQDEAAQALYEQQQAQQAMRESYDARVAANAQANAGSAGEAGSAGSSASDGQGSGAAAPGGSAMPVTGEAQQVNAAPEPQVRIDPSISPEPRVRIAGSSEAQAEADAIAEAEAEAEAAAGSLQRSRLGMGRLFGDD